MLRALIALATEKLLERLPKAARRAALPTSPLVIHKSLSP